MKSIKLQKKTSCSACKWMRLRACVIVTVIVGLGLGSFSAEFIIDWLIDWLLWISVNALLSNRMDAYCQYAVYSVQCIRWTVCFQLSLLAIWRCGFVSFPRPLQFPFRVNKFMHAKVQPVKCGTGRCVHLSFRASAFRICMPCVCSCDCVCVSVCEFACCSSLQILFAAFIFFHFHFFFPTHKISYCMKNFHNNIVPVVISSC